ncbi:MAG: serine hydrolase [Clostridia bacterium]|nr:serine hydrolase [Clostridia bacterium]
MKENKKISLERADYPEQVGVSSREVAELIKDFKESNIEVHSLMILRHGKVAFESWADPYAPDIPHAMYSVSKSFTSAAVGFAVSEGLITTETRLIDIFPEFRKDEPDANLEMLSVHHLLSMQSGKGVSVFTDKGKNQWIKDFFDAPWSFTPGDGHWEYISENQYMLCAMLTRVTGMSVIEYLTPRLFEPLGIDIPFWEHDIDGIEAGGWGLFLKTEDVAKFTLCYQQKGMFNGKQVIPAYWVHKSQKIQAENSAFNKTPDSQSGYGYCFWRCAGTNGYRADGMFSQFGIVAKDYDACLILTAGEIAEQKTRDCIWRHFPKCLIENDAEQTPEEKPSLAPLDDDLPEMPRSELEEHISGRKIKFQKNLVLSTAGFPVSMLPIPIVYMSGDRAGGITNVVFGFQEKTCTMTWDEGDEHNTIVCGMDGVARKSPMTLAGMPFTANATAAWTGENELTIHMRPLQAVCQRIIKFVFDDDDEVTFYPSSKQPITALAEYLKKDVDVFFPPFAPAQKLGTIAFEQAHRVIDIAHKGKFAREDAAEELEAADEETQANVDNKKEKWIKKEFWKERNRDEEE